MNLQPAPNRFREALLPDQLVCAYGCRPFSESKFRERLAQLGYETIAESRRVNLKKENLLGEGKNCGVFSIDGISDYVWRVPRRLTRLISDDVIVLADPFAHLNFGQPVAQFGNSFLQKRVTGEVCFKSTENHQETSQKISDHCQTLIHFPQSVYNLFVGAVREVNRIGWRLDSKNPGNILIDRLSQTITPIDFERAQAGGVRSPDRLSDVVNSVFQTSSLTQLGEESVRPLAENAREILQKLIEASLLLKIPKGDPQDSDFRLVCSWANIDYRLLCD